MQFFYEHPRLSAIAQQTRSIQFPTHLHQQPELYYQIRGTTAVTLDRVRYVVEPGDLAVILPHRLHSYASLGEGLAYLCIAEVSLLGEYATPLLRHACAEPILAARDVHPDVPHSLAALSARLPEPLAKGYLAVLFGRILERLSFAPAREQADHALLPRVMRYVQQNIREPLSLEQVAMALGISKYRLSRLFSLQIGLGFSAYLNALRVELAQCMLREGDLPITQVLYACGFESERTFYRAFQAHCRMTPGQYKHAALLHKSTGAGESHA